MTNLTEKPEWAEGIYQLETSDPVLGGPEGISNIQAKALGNRTQWLKEQQTQNHQALIEHERSRNHPDASLYAKGMVKLTDSINLSDSTLAATAKAVKTVSEQSCQKAQNLADVQNKHQAVANLGLRDTLHPQKRISIGNLGTGLFDGSQPAINIGDSDSGLLSQGDGGVTLVANNQEIGYWNKFGVSVHGAFQSRGGSFSSVSVDNCHYWFRAPDGTERGVIWADPQGELHLRASNGPAMTVQKDGSLSVSGVVSANYQDSNAWADQYHTKAPLYTDITNNGPSSYHPLTKIRATIPNVASWAISQGVICQSNTIAYHLHMKGSGGQDVNFAWDTGGNYHVQNTLYAAGNVQAAAHLYAGNGASYLRSDGLVYGPGWGGFAHEWIQARIAEQVVNRATWDWVNQHFVTDIRLGAVESVMAWRGPGYHDQPPYVVTGVYNGNYDEFIDVAHRRPLQKCINGVWYNVGGL